MFLVRAPIIRESGSELGILNDEQVFGILFLSGLREIKAPSDYGASIDHHHFVVGDRVLAVDETSDAGMGQEICRGISFGFLAAVQNHLDIDTSFPCVHQRSGNRGGREGICLNEHRQLRSFQGVNNRLGAAASGRKKYVDCGRVFIRRDQRTAPEANRQDDRNRFQVTTQFHAEFIL